MHNRRVLSWKSRFSGRKLAQKGAELCREETAWSNHLRVHCCIRFSTMAQQKWVRYHHDNAYTMRARQSIYSNSSELRYKACSHRQHGNYDHSTAFKWQEFRNHRMPIYGECLFMRQHKQISHSLHRRAGNGRCLTVAGWAGNCGASVGESLPSTFRTFIFCSSFPDGRKKVTVNPRAHAFIKRISHFRSRTEVTLKWTSKLEKKSDCRYYLPRSIDWLPVSPVQWHAYFVQQMTKTEALQFNQRTQHI